MVVRCEHMHENGSLYIWHAPSQVISFAPDEVTHHPKEGPQLNKLKPTLRAADGKVYVRLLKRKRTRKGMYMDNISGMTGDPCDSGLFEYMKTTAPKTYETNFKELLLSAYDGVGGKNKKNLSSYFCSELVAQTFITMGILWEDEPSNEYVPSDFNTKLVLEGGYELGELVRIVF